jgi:CheY-like chemotaxis protein
MSAPSKTILVVDDDFDVREALCDVLREEGFPVAAVADGVEALEYLRAQPAPTLILLDLMMPRMDGAQFRAEQQRDPDLATIPVVLLSADTRIVEMTETLSAHGYLRKPVDLHRLIETVRYFHTRH